MTSIGPSLAPKFAASGWLLLGTLGAIACNASSAPTGNDAARNVTGAGAGATDAATLDPSASSTNVARVAAVPLPVVETASFAPSGPVTDIADDSAIYANPSLPERSVVVADNKDTRTGGVAVFDMQGKLLQFRQDGTIGNIDLRTGFQFRGQSIVLVGANRRNDNSLIFWQLNPDTQQLSAPIGASITTITSNYGFCLYHSSRSGKFYAFVTQETGRSTLQQYELSETSGADDDPSTSQIAASLVRSFEVGSITEACVTDDELGWLYVAQEDVAIWKYDAEPSAGNARVEVAAVGDGHVIDDLEGIALAKGPGTSGYLVVSVQSESRFVMYDRETNAYLGGFAIGANDSIDAVTQTDGLDISTSDLGPGFPRGALVVHDGGNTNGDSSNLKYVPLE